MEVEGIGSYGTSPPDVAIKGDWLGYRECVGCGVAYGADTGAVAIGINVDLLAVCVAVAVDCDDQRITYGCSRKRASLFVCCKGRVVEEDGGKSVLESTDLALADQVEDGGVLGAVEAVWRDLGCAGLSATTLATASATTTADDQIRHDLDAHLNSIEGSRDHDGSHQHFAIDHRHRRTCTTRVLDAAEAIAAAWILFACGA